MRDISTELNQRQVGICDHCYSAFVLDEDEYKLMVDEVNLKCPICEELLFGIDKTDPDNINVYLLIDNLIQLFINEEIGRHRLTDEIIHLMRGESILTENMPEYYKNHASGIQPAENDNKPE